MPRFDKGKFLMPRIQSHYTHLLVLLLEVLTGQGMFFLLSDPDVFILTGGGFTIKLIKIGFQGPFQ